MISLSMAELYTDCLVLFCTLGILLMKCSYYFISFAGPQYGDCVSMENLLDALVVLFDECSNSTLRKEKTIMEFIEWVAPVVKRIKNLRLSRDDFEVGLFLMFCQFFPIIYLFLLIFQSDLKTMEVWLS